MPEGGNPRVSEELPMHINQLLIYDSYIQLPLKILRGSRAKKTWSLLKPDTKVIGNSIPIMSLTHNTANKAKQVINDRNKIALKHKGRVLESYRGGGTPQLRHLQNKFHFLPFPLCYI